MRTRIITAIVAISIVLPILLFGDWPFFALMSVVLVLGVIEVVSNDGKGKEQAH